MDCTTHEIQEIKCPTKINDFTVVYFHNASYISLLKSA